MFFENRMRPVATSTTMAPLYGTLGPNDAVEYDGIDFVGGVGRAVATGFAAGTGFAIDAGFAVGAGFAAAGLLAG